MNAFESGERKNIPATLIYVRNQGKVLMIHRNKRDPLVDVHYGKYNGLGGKGEKDESYVETARRELFEESGLDFPLNRFSFLGLIQFPNFKPKKSEDWSVAIFGVEAQDAELASLKKENDEGTLQWIPDEEVLSLRLWAGDQKFLPYVLKRQPFWGSIYYQGSEVIRAWVSPIG